MQSNNPAGGNEFEDKALQEQREIARDLAPFTLPESLREAIESHRKNGGEISPAQERFLEAETVPLSVNDALNLGRDRERTSFLEAVNSATGDASDTAAKADAEAKGLLLKAEQAVAEMFLPITESPAVKAFFDLELPLKSITTTNEFRDPSLRSACNRWVQIVKEALKNETAYGADGKLSEGLYKSLADSGYWGLLVPKEYGGFGASMSDAEAVIRKIAVFEPTVAGLASINGCIGAVYPVKEFGTAEQKERFLPDIAMGKILSAFALTERQAGSDLSRPETLIRIEGDEAVINGQKLFISNAGYGKRIALLAMDENYKLRELSGQLERSEGKKMVVAVIDLPDGPTENFQVLKYGIRALRRIENVGLRFKDFRIPKENILLWDAEGENPTATKGMNIGYMGLNRGRTSLASNASGVMTSMAYGLMKGWEDKAKNFGTSSQELDLIDERIGLAMAYSRTSEYLASFTAELLDLGFRPEIECEVAKIFGSEHQKEVADLIRRSEGMRFSAPGHPVRENYHEITAPCIYEGEGDMLTLHIIKNLIDPDVMLKHVGMVPKNLVPGLEKGVSLPIPQRRTVVAAFRSLFPNGEFSREAVKKHITPGLQDDVTFAAQAINAVSGDLLLKKLPSESIKMGNAWLGKKVGLKKMLPIISDPSLINDLTVIRNRGKAIVGAISMIVTAVRASERINDLKADANTAEAAAEYALATTGLAKYKSDILGGNDQFRLRARTLAKEAGAFLRDQKDSGLTEWFDGLDELPEWQPEEDASRFRVVRESEGSRGTEIMRGVNSILPWASKRISMGMAIDKRDLVQERVGYASAYAFTARYLEEFFEEHRANGDLAEPLGNITHIFSSDREIESTFEYVMKTIGGRFFLKGQEIGDALDKIFARSNCEVDKLNLPSNLRGNLLLSDNPVAEFGGKWPYLEAAMPGLIKSVGNMSSIPRQFRNPLRGAFRILDNVALKLYLEGPEQQSGPKVAQQSEVITDAVAAIVTIRGALRGRSDNAAEKNLELELAQVGAERYLYDITGGGFQNQDRVCGVAVRAGRTLIEGVKDDSITWFEHFEEREILENYVDVRPERKRRK